MKKSINLFALFVLVSVNVFTPVSYAQSGETLEIPESAATGSFVEENQLPEEVETPEVSEETVELELQSAIDIISRAVDEYKETTAQELENADTPEEEKSEKKGEEIISSEPDESLNPAQGIDEGIVETMGEGEHTSQDGCYTYKVLDEENKKIEIVEYIVGSGSCAFDVDLRGGVDSYNVVSIGEYAFARHINDGTFYGHTITVNTIILSDTVERIGTGAFNVFSSSPLKKITLGKNLKYLGNYAFGESFHYSSYDLEVVFPEGFDYDGLKIDGDGWFYLKGGENNCFNFDVKNKNIVGYLCEGGNVEIPNTIRGFTVMGIVQARDCGTSMFSSSFVNMLTIPNTITMIGENTSCLLPNCPEPIVANAGDDKMLSTNGAGLGVGIKSYPGQELSSELTSDMLSSACMYIMPEEEYTVRFFNENGSLLKEVKVNGYIDEEVVPVIEEREGLQATWVDQYGNKYNGEILSENLDLYLRYIGVIHEPRDITYTDTNGYVFSGIGTITFTDGVNSITMLDRNLGAKGESSGYYFQWGNNYGFLPGENEIDEERVDVTGYGRNNPYVSEKFIVNTGQWNYSELSENDEEEYADGLWGGVGDYRDNTWDSSEGHDYMRQGPCPDGYHVPSGGEIIELVSLWSNANNVTTTPNDKLAINISRYSGFYDFLDDFRLPLNGRIDYNISLQPTIGGDTEESFKENLKLKNSNKFTYFWSSSPYYLTDNFSHEELYGKSRRLSIGPNAKAHGSIERSNGFPVRCFADNYAEGDEPLVLSYDTRGGSAIQAQTIPEGENEYLPGYTTHRTGYELLGWYDDQGELELDGNKITNRTIESDLSEDGVVTIYARWSDDHVVTFKDYDGSVIKVVLVKNGANAQSPANPTREGYKFTGWDKDLNSVTEDMEVTAQYSSSSNGGYSGGGGSSSKPDKSHNSADDKEILDTKDSSQKVEEQPSQGKTLDTTNPSKEIFNAHQWAYSNGLTKYRTAGEARMDDPLNRSEMAKISSIFATQFLDKVPNEKKKEFCSQYPDLWKVTSDMEAFIIESCELGYMGYESNGIDALERFRPYTPVTVAEAATILSRIVRGNDNAMNGKDWYKGHLYATYNHGLIDDIQDPTKRSITRREAYLMLYRLIKDK